MLEAITIGLITGFALSWTFGTVFFMLIQTSIQHGYKKGFYIASGVVATDLLFILISLLGISLIPDIKQAEKYLGGGGGLVLVAWGIVNIFLNNTDASTKHEELPEAIKKKNWKEKPLYFALIGALLNIVNPINIFSWVFVSTSVFPSYSHSFTENFIFYSVCLTMIFGCECLISYTAHSMRKWYSKKFIRFVKMLTGLVFIALGVYLINNYIVQWKF